MSTRTSTRWLVVLLDDCSTDRAEWYGLYRQQKDALRNTKNQPAIAIEIAVSLEGDRPDLMVGYSSDLEDRQHLSTRNLFVIKDDLATDGAEWYGLFRRPKDALSGIQDRPGIAIQVVVDTTANQPELVSISYLS